MEKNDRELRTRSKVPGSLTHTLGVTRSHSRGPTWGRLTGARPVKPSVQDDGDARGVFCPCRTKKLSSYRHCLLNKERIKYRQKFCLIPDQVVTSALMKFDSLFRVI